MRHLVIGGGGFLGGNLLAALARAGVPTRCLDTRAAAADAARGGDCEWLRGDFTQPADLAAALAGVEVVYHMAAPFFIPEGQRQPARDVELNLVAGVKLLTACVDAGVRRVVFPSSGGAVYGPACGARPLQESDRAQPVVSYGIVKLALEGYLAMFHAARGLEYAALRVSNPYGPGQTPHRGQGVVATLLGCAQTGAAFELLAPRSTVRDFVYVEDVVGAFVAAGRAPGTIAEVLNIGSGQGVDLGRLIVAVETITGREIAVVVQTPRAFDVPVNVLDCRRAAETLGWRATTALEAGLRQTWEWVQRQGESGKRKDEGSRRN